MTAREQLIELFGSLPNEKTEFDEADTHLALVLYVGYCARRSISVEQDIDHSALRTACKLVSINDRRIPVHGRVWAMENLREMLGSVNTRRAVFESLDAEAAEALQFADNLTKAIMGASDGEA